MRMHREILREIGQQLDEDIFPRIMNGGIVTPGEAAVPISTWAMEVNHERPSTRRPETGSRTWRPREEGEGKTWGCGASGNASPFICTDLKHQYEGELTTVQEAYPGARAWIQNEGLWLITESALLPGLSQKAVFLTGIPFSRTRTVRGWGFWKGIPLKYSSWIGPRHTNSPDGSICAFEPRDGTWKLGDSLLVLLDLYTLWAFRHLHLQVFKKWPGRQVAHFAYERLAELNPSEYCGCGSNRQYDQCCRENDLKGDLVLKALSYFHMGCGIHVVPEIVTTFIQGQDKPPQITDLLFPHVLLFPV